MMQRRQRRNVGRTGRDLATDGGEDCVALLPWPVISNNSPPPGTEAIAMNRARGQVHQCAGAAQVGLAVDAIGDGSHDRYRKDQGLR